MSLYNKQIYTYYAEATDVFRLLLADYNIVNVYSYRESGIQLTWDRDKAISHLFQEYNVAWNESNMGGVLRGITNRDNWDKNCYVLMNQAIIKNQYKLDQNPILPQDIVALPDALIQKLESYPNQYQPAVQCMALSKFICSKARS